MRFRLTKRRALGHNSKKARCVYMRDLRQTPILRVEWHGARGFDPVGREPLERGAKGGEH